MYPHLAVPTVQESAKRTPVDDEGWYPDPYHPTHLRWWDGELWTSNVRVTPRSTSARTVSPFSYTEIDPLLQHVVAVGVRPVLRDDVL